jgi:hypothetical protein
VRVDLAAVGAVAVAVVGDTYTGEEQKMNRRREGERAQWKTEEEYETRTEQRKGKEKSALCCDDDDADGKDEPQYLVKPLAVQRAAHFSGVPPLPTEVLKEKEEKSTIDS